MFEMLGKTRSASSFRGTASWSYLNQPYKSQRYVAGGFELWTTYGIFVLLAYRISYLVMIWKTRRYLLESKLAFSGNPDVPVC